MARTAKPWWWEERQAYYATVGGVRYRLGSSLKEAKNELKALQKAPSATVTACSVAALLDDFLDWNKENRAETTYAFYKHFCQSFSDACGLMDVSDVTGADVTAWLKDQTSWNSTTKHDAITCLKRAFNWSVKNRGLKANPIALMEKPKAKNRTEMLTVGEMTRLLRSVRDKRFRDLLRFSWYTGCRPQETKKLESLHVDLEKSRCTMIGKGDRLRVIYMPPKALLIVKRLIKLYPTGPLFRNKWGNRWTGAAVKCRFDRLEDKLGRRYFQYMWRHTWITQKLRRGVDSHIVAGLAGHSDTKMLDKVYSHVAEDHRFMLEQAGK